MDLRCYTRWLHLSALSLALVSLVVAGCAVFGKDKTPDPVIAARPDTPNLAALRRAVTDLAATYPDTFKNGPAWLERIGQYEQKLAAAPGGADTTLTAEIIAFQREVLLANPLLSGFDRILIVKRNAEDKSLGLPQNWQGNCSLPLTNYNNEIAFLSLEHPEGPLTTLYKPEKTLFVGDMDLNFDGKRLLFSMPGSHDRSQIWEIGIDGTGLRQVTAGADADVDNYDACYLPDGRIIYDSTACYTGIPCVSGWDSVANLCVMNADGAGIRQLCFDQDHDWSPTVLNNGRLLYTRWEYTDLPHSNTRLLFHMNPDGTEQMEYYGSNSYWPTSVMYARPIPNHPTKVVAIITGHHGVPRMGELAVLDPAKGRYESEGATQRIPGYGKPVEPVIIDNLADNSWPKFLHPYPLSDKYFLVACKPTPDALWGIYLVDVFDNMTLLREEPGQALLEPIPVRATPPPPAIPDKVRPGDKETTVYIADVYAGPGLKGVPRGAVKNLRLISYTYAYRKTGGLLGIIGMDGPWDIKHILGVVPVEEDGSVYFRAPANTPIAVQPLDGQGRALQLMRSWFTGMPGETVSCVGCHDRQNASPSSRLSTAAKNAPVDITPWRGPARPFSFAREVQPVLDHYCLRCHDGGKPGQTDLRGDVMIKDYKTEFPGNGGDRAGKFSAAYASLHRFVRRPGIESDYHLLTPLEFHADTTELVQMLEKGHYGVTLDAEAWDRINTWIDLNTPYHGYWSEIVGNDFLKDIAARRRTLQQTYANVDMDYEKVIDTEMNLPPVADKSVRTVAPARPQPPATTASAQAVAPETRTVDLGGGVALEMVRVPAGSFMMGGAEEGKPTRVIIDKPFWLGRTEISNEQFARFDPYHDSKIESMHAYQFGIHGYPMNTPKQPVIRVSWEQAAAFCAWLAERTGQACTLPTEAQWEYACRAGAQSDFSYGGLDTDFSTHANLGDKRLSEFARNTYVQVNLLPNPNKYDDWAPKDARFDDGAFLTAEVGKYKPNPWGLYDMHGNVWEWTLSAMKAYPYNDADGRNAAAGDAKRVVRGGSWYDRPLRATAAYRLAYEPWQKVFNVGFRIACPAEE